MAVAPGFPLDVHNNWSHHHSECRWTPVLGRSLAFQPHLLETWTPTLEQLSRHCYCEGLVVYYELFLSWFAWFVIWSISSSIIWDLFTIVPQGYSTGACPSDNHITMKCMVETTVPTVYNKYNEWATYVILGMQYTRNVSKILPFL